MLSQLSRVSRSTALRAITRGNTIQARSFIAPTISRKADFVQDLYLSEIRNYKTPAVKASDSQGQVLEFKVPATPQSPEETDLASNIKEYENMAVEIEGQSASAASGQPAAQRDWLEEEEEEEAKH